MEELFCIGCGAKLQSENESKDGYVDPKALNREKILCKRCFQLAHYGKFSKVDDINSTIKKLHESASKNDLIILIADVSLSYAPLIPVLKELNSFKHVILLLNRYDLYKQFLTINKANKFIKNEIKKAGLHIEKTFIINDNIDEIFDYIDNNSIDKNAYLVGVENAGKTTFINKLLKSLANEKEDVLVSSKYPGTTIDLIKIPLTDETYIIDSPGIKSKGNILNYLSKSFIKKVSFDKKIKQVVYQLYSPQSLILSNILILDNLNEGESPVIFYGSSCFEFLRCKYVKSKDTFNNIINELKLKDDNIKSYDDLDIINIDVKDDYNDIVIEGLGFFKVRKGKYVIHTIKGCNVYSRESII